MTTKNSATTTHPTAHMTSTIHAEVDADAASVVIETANPWLIMSLSSLYSGGFQEEPGLEGGEWAAFKL
jgi:hypothetical protein